MGDDVICGASVHRTNFPAFLSSSLVLNFSVHDMT